MSPAYISSFDCETCDRTFSSEEALEQHLRDSPVHSSSFDCETCDRTFSSVEALEQHLRDSPVHQEQTETPLDKFFRSFPTFTYDPSLSPAISYAKLQEQKRWRHGDPESDHAWKRYQDALQSEFNMWYGAEDDLDAWHALCRAISIEPLAKTCGQCEKVTRRTHVNIIDLLEWGRRNGAQKVPTFQTVAELRTYTKETGKVFRNTLGQGDGNVVLRHLLRNIYRQKL